MSKHVGEKCGKLCISSILSPKRGITPTNIPEHANGAKYTCHEHFKRLFLLKCIKETNVKFEISDKMDGHRVTTLKLDL